MRWEHPLSASDQSQKKRDDCQSSPIGNLNPHGSCHSSTLCEKDHHRQRGQRVCRAAVGTEGTDGHGLNPHKPESPRENGHRQDHQHVECSASFRGIAMVQAKGLKEKDHVKHQTRDGNGDAHPSPPMAGKHLVTIGFRPTAWQGSTPLDTQIKGQGCGNQQAKPHDPKPHATCGRSVSIRALSCHRLACLGRRFSFFLSHDS